MPARGLSSVALCALTLLFACKHDLDALRVSGGSVAGSGASGSGASGSGASGTDGGGQGGSGGGSGGSGGSGGTGGAPPKACEPCPKPEPISSGAVTVTPNSCCTGAGNAQCGVSFDVGTRCYPLQAPGEANTSCDDLTRGMNTFAGCCRPDGQCGVVVDAVGLGCVARVDIPLVLGGPLTPRPCDFHCAGDADCQALSDALICVEDSSTHKAETKFCARECQRDKDCEGVPGTVCVLLSNISENRVDAFCRKKLGSAAQGEACSSADDCEHGACAPDTSVTPTRLYCTQLCGSDQDCAPGAESCEPAGIATPDMTGDPITVRICEVVP